MDFFPAFLCLHSCKLNITGNKFIWQDLKMSHVGCSAVKWLVHTVVHYSNEAHHEKTRCFSPLIKSWYWETCDFSFIHQMSEASISVSCKHIRCWHVSRSALVELWRPWLPGWWSYCPGCVLHSEVWTYLVKTSNNSSNKTWCLSGLCVCACVWWIVIISGVSWSRCCCSKQKCACSLVCVSTAHTHLFELQHLYEFLP